MPLRKASPSVSPLSTQKKIFMMPSEGYPNIPKCGSIMGTSVWAQSLAIFLQYNLGGSILFYKGLFEAIDGVK